MFLKLHYKVVASLSKLWCLSPHSMNFYRRRTAVPILGKNGTGKNRMLVVKFSQKPNFQSPIVNHKPYKIFNINSENLPFAPSFPFVPLLPVPFYLRYFYQTPPAYADKFSKKVPVTSYFIIT